MNKSLRFLAIGLALAVLLVSQVGVDRSTEAAAPDVKNDTVEFVAGLGNDAQLQSFYRTDAEVAFYLKDPDLALPTANRKSTLTFTVPNNQSIGEGTEFRIKVPLTAARKTALDTPGPSHDGNQNSTTTLENPAPGGPGAGAGGVTYTKDKYWDEYSGGADMPLDGAPVVTVANAGGTGQSGNGNRIVSPHDVTDGTFAFLGDVAGQDATYDSDGNVLTATTTITVTFKYHVADVFTADQTAGTSAGADQNRARVTSSSDGIGEWVTLTEVSAVGATTTHPTTGIYRGEIKLSDNASEASLKEGLLGVRDGDTLTVAFYNSDHTTLIDDDTATIDGQKPTIVSVSPTDKTVTDRSSPVVTVTVADEGSGFDTNNPRDHVDITIIDGMNTCKVIDSNLTATRLSSSEIDILFRNTGTWISGGAGIPCDKGSSVTILRVDSAGITPAANNHGRQFEIKVEALDVAGNTSEKPVKVTIDTKAPSIDDGSSTGLGWDAAKKKETNDSASIKVAFNEGLDVSTVDASDFVVENPDASIESVQVGGVDTDDSKDSNKYVYLKLAADLASDARPRVELDGSIMDKAGNELKTAAITRVEDRIKPGVTVDEISAQLLAKDGEAAVTFTADENMAANTAAVASDKCTCLGITGGSNGTKVTRGNVALPTPPNGTYTFKAGSVTGLFGVMVQASDIRANVTRVGATKVTDEKTKVTTVTVIHEADAVATTTNNSTYSFIVSLAKWPLADAAFTGSLASAVTIKEHAGATVTDVDPTAGMVTLEVTYKNVGSKQDHVQADDELMATYHYVKTEQTIEVDLAAPTAEFSPSGDTQDARPFIQIKWDEDEYAGDMHKTVTVTEATLTDADGNETALVDDTVNMLSTTDNIMYSYLPDSDLALGEYTITAVGRDSAGNVSETQTGKFKVVARPPVSIPLNLGWNLISLPGEPADNSIDAVINVDEVSQVLTYDPTVEGGWVAAVRVNGSFEGALTMIDAKRAYLVYTTSVAPLKVDIPPLDHGVVPPSIMVYKGWNMIPSASVDAAFPARDIDDYLSGVKWSRGYYYDSNGRLTGFTPGTSDDELVQKGRGFLIYVTEDGTLVP